MPLKASTQLSDPSEWSGLANEVWSRGLCMWLPTAALFAPKGVPVVSGFFGEPKAKPVPGHPELPQLRLICNLVPSDSYFRTIRGDIDGLLYSPSAEHDRSAGCRTIADLAGRYDLCI